MTLVSDLIADAYREGNITAVGKSPSTAQLTEALPRFNRILNSVFGFGIGEKMHDWMAPQPQRTSSVNADYPLMYGKPDLDSDTYKNPPKNSRIVWGGTALTLYFPQKPDDGSRMSFVQGSGVGAGGSSGTVLTLDGNGRTIEGADTLAITNPGAAKQWLYRADLGDWILVKSDLALTDDCPFPEDFDDLWIGLVFMRLAPRYGKTVSQETVAMVNAARNAMQSRYKQSQNERSGGKQITNSVQSYGWYPA